MTKYYVQYIYIYQQVFVTKLWHVNDSLLWTLFVGDINLRQVAKVVLCNLVIPCLYHPRIFETGLHISDSKQQLKMVTHSMDLNESPAASFETCQFLLNMDVMSKFDKEAQKYGLALSRHMRPFPKAFLGTDDHHCQVSRLVWSQARCTSKCFAHASQKDLQSFPQLLSQFAELWQAKRGGSWNKTAHQGDFRDTVA